MLRPASISFRNQLISSRVMGTGSNGTLSLETSEPSGETISNWSFVGHPITTSPKALTVHTTFGA